MKRFLSYIFGVLVIIFASVPIMAKNASLSNDTWVPLSQVKSEKQDQKDVSYHEAILKTSQMTIDSRAVQLMAKYGLHIMNLTWEDTGRYKNSSVGPNISDMTIQVGQKNALGKYDLTLMPVIRHDNFSDKTADIDPLAFTLLVGNEKDKTLKRISLREFLEDPTKYLSEPKSWLNPKKSLLADRDKRVLVSAQACFLPVPQKGKAEFNPVLFNYQSVSGDPAVLSILVTRQGTSVTVIDNKRDSLQGGWGQRLFHNQNGQRASLTGERMSNFTQRNVETESSEVRLNMKKSSGLNMVLLIQVPLKQKNPPRFENYLDYEPAPPPAPMMSVGAKEKSNVEAAVIGHGNYEGPFTEIDHLNIERDSKFPVRVTVQFYKATSNGVLSEEDAKQIKEEIDSVYESGDTVGSLVVDGEIGRPTEYEGLKIRPSAWWKIFWKRYEQNTGENPHQSMVRLQKLLGEKYEEGPASELYLVDQLKHR